ncbi:helix-turn-helix domain-containing protein [Haladaptatus pallidirubidus]|uniref:helix-turn-helix domain-containing protein n=1 Tax=Haladaptatus pallidirubidus TaxID=1008152 RepID=UPI0035EBBED7
MAALESGYYDIPRGISGEELSDDLGISHQALSERLRRAYKNLISNALVVGENELR